MAHTQDFSVTQSSDCKTLTLTDTSTYDGSGLYQEANIVERRWVINKTTDEVDTTPIVAGGPSIQYTLDKDYALEIKFSVDFDDGVGNTDTETLVKDYYSCCFVDKCFVERTRDLELKLEEGPCDEDEERLLLYDVLRQKESVRIRMENNDSAGAQEILDSLKTKICD